MTLTGPIRIGLRVWAVITRLPRILPDCQVGASHCPGSRREVNILDEPTAHRSDLFPSPMDDSNASTILVSVFKAVFRGLVVLSAYTWTLLYSVLYVITWPVLSVSNGLLSIALLPLRILLKFEVSHHSNCRARHFSLFTLTHTFQGNFDIWNGRCHHWSYRRHLSISYRRFPVQGVSIEFVRSPETNEYRLIEN